MRSTWTHGGHVIAVWTEETPDHMHLWRFTIDGAHDTRCTDPPLRQEHMAFEEGQARALIEVERRHRHERRKP